jgi:hypothetical protein
MHPELVNFEESEHAVENDENEQDAVSSVSDIDIDVIDSNNGQSSFVSEIDKESDSAIDDSDVFSDLDSNDGSDVLPEMVDEEIEGEMSEVASVRSTQNLNGGWP